MAAALHIMPEAGEKHGKTNSPQTPSIEVRHSRTAITLTRAGSAAAHAISGSRFGCSGEPKP